MLLLFFLVLDVRLQFKCLRRKFLTVRYGSQVRKWQTLHSFSYLKSDCRERLRIYSLKCSSSS